MPASPDIQDKLAALLKNYRSQLPTRLQEIDELWNQVCERGEMGDPGRELYRLVHSLAGSGASFGFSELSKKAKDFENCLKPYCDNGSPLDEAAQQQLNPSRTSLYDELNRVFSEEG